MAWQVVKQKKRKPSPVMVEWKELEKDITKAVRDFLKLRGWRPFRMQHVNLGSSMSFSAGEKSMPDYLFLRYLPGSVLGGSIVLWIEFKAPSKQATVAQVEWHQDERERGAIVLVVDNPKKFAELYDKQFGFLHSGPHGIGQLDLLAGV